MTSAPLLRSREVGSRVWGAASRSSLALALLTEPATALAAGDGGFSFTEQGFYIIDFAVLVAVLWWVGRKPVAKYLKNRRANVIDEMAKAEALSKQAQSVLDEYQRKLADLETERKRILGEFQTAGERERQRIVAEARKTADRLVSDTERRLDQESKRLMALLEQDVIEAAMAAATEAVRARVTPEVERKLLDESVAAIERSGPSLQ